MRNTFLKIGAIAFFMFVLTACFEPSHLEQALVLAGENRAELEKVLAYYSKSPADSLKYKAACFLVENMPGHYSYKNNASLDRYYEEIRSSVSYGYSRDENKDIIEKISAKYDPTGFKYVPDITIVTGDYLIDNIEKASDVWQNGEWATHVSFDDFCEYILPYKGVELQPLDDWRDYCLNLLEADLDTLHFCDRYKNSAYHAATTVSREIIGIKQQELPIGGVNAIPVQDIRTLLSIPFGTCNDYSILAMAAIRSKGIPVMEDFTPQWPFQAQGHSWNIILLNNGKNMIFSAGSSNPGELHNPDNKMAKVFRHTYAINRDVLKIHMAEQFVPPVFKNRFIRDVTGDYMAVSDIEIAVPRGERGKHAYAYLAVFDNKNWIPIHYGKVSGNKVVFDKMGRNNMYLPVFYTQNGIAPLAEPFFITPTGEVRKIRIDKDIRQEMTVYRKYFIAGHCYDVGRRMKGGLFQASNRPDFSDAVTLHTIPSMTVQSGEVNLNENGNEYRYWRYVSAKEGHNNAAEVYFYTPGREKALYGTIIGTGGSYTNQKNNEKEVVFDGDPLTYFDALEPSGSWAGMDFGQLVKINRIAYTPRGDGNDVTPGDIHELLYWDKNGWVSLGKREATDIKLVYENVPSDGLYLLRNHSRGQDERIFTYENGKQVWW
jgi:hypothetical protein